MKSRYLSFLKPSSSARGEVSSEGLRTREKPAPPPLFFPFLLAKLHGALFPSFLLFPPSSRPDRSLSPLSLCRVGSMPPHFPSLVYRQVTEIYMGKPHSVFFFFLDFPSRRGWGKWRSSLSPGSSRDRKPDPAFHSFLQCCRAFFLCRSHAASTSRSGLFSPRRS